MPPRLRGHMAGVEDDVTAVFQCLTFLGFEDIPHPGLMFTTIETYIQLPPDFIGTYCREVLAEPPSKRAFSGVRRAAENNQQRRASGGLQPDKLRNALGTAFLL